MASVLNSRLGKVYLLGSNPRSIRDSAFNLLVESLERDEGFLRMRGIIVWRVPERLELLEGQKSPFTGQEGKLVILGGNMRARALKALGKEELKDEWMIEAKDGEGNWISADEAERLVLVDNGAIGISGTNDYEVMLKNFNEHTMRAAGIDFSEFEELMSKMSIVPTLNGVDEEGKKDTDRIEEGEIGEKSDELKDFIAERERTRANLKEVDDAGFHLLLVFAGGLEEKAEFIEKCGVFKGAVVADNGPYLDLVFESFAQKMQFVSEMGLESPDAESGLPAIMYGLFCDGRAFAKKMGIELKETGLHFRDRIVDNQLAEMAQEVGRQKTEEEVQEEVYAKLKAERKELGMDSRGGVSKKKKGKKGKDGTANSASYDDPGPGVFVAEDM